MTDRMTDGAIIALMDLLALIYHCLIHPTTTAWWSFDECSQLIGVYLFFTVNYRLLVDGWEWTLTKKKKRITASLVSVPPLIESISTQNIAHCSAFICLWSSISFLGINLEMWDIVTSDRLIPQEPYLFSSSKNVLTWIVECVFWCSRYSSYKNICIYTHTHRFSCWWLSAVTRHQVSGYSNYLKWNIHTTIQR